jgi:hypothetical protein
MAMTPHIGFGILKSKKFSTLNLVGRTNREQNENNP